MDPGKTILVVAASLAVALAFNLRASDPLCDGLTPDTIYPFPHEYNCSLYYECLNGDKTTLVCADDLYYNKVTQTCDFQDQSGCTNTVPVCLDIELDYLPQPDDCTKYIECYKGDAYLMSCPSGYWFDSQEKKCVLPEESDCAGNSSTPTPTGSTPSETTESLSTDTPTPTTPGTDTPSPTASTGSVTPTPTDTPTPSEVPTSTVTPSTGPPSTAAPTTVPPTTAPPTTVLPTTLPGTTLV